MEPDITNVACNSTVSFVLPAGQVVEVGRNQRILPEGVSGVGVIIHHGLAREFTRNHVVEDTKTISAIRVSMIVFKFSNSLIFRADVIVGRGTHCVDLQIVPVAVSIRACCMVASKVIVGIGDPETGWGLICVQKTPRTLGHYNKVVVDLVVAFNSILNEHVVAHDVVDNVLEDSEVACAVHCEGSVETLMHRVALDIRIMHIADHVEMDSISTQLEGLTHVSELYVLKSGSERVITH